VCNIRKKTSFLIVMGILALNVCGIGVVPLMEGYADFACKHAPLARKTIYVDDDGSADFTKIQDALNAASNDDTIFVFNGTYYENIEIFKRVSVEGENWHSTIIDGTRSDSVVKIMANGVTLRNFTIKNSESSSTAAGVYIASSHNTINNNNISHNNGCGIYAENSNNNQIFLNIIKENHYDGIYFISSENNVITNNMILNHTLGFYPGSNIPRSHGIVLEYASMTTVSDNIFSNSNNADLTLRSSSFITIKNNQFSNMSGLIITGGTLLYWTTHTIENNFITNKPIYYYKNEKNDVTVPSDAGQVILANCENFKIQNLTISGGDTAILLGFSSNNIISDNIISNAIEGFFLVHSDNNIITGNTIFQVYGNPLTYSSNNIISDNIIKNNIRYGTGLWYSSNNNTIYENEIVNNTENGIVVYESLSNTISLNRIRNNLMSGIVLYYASSNTIYGNTIADNRDYGLKVLYTSTNNHVHHNGFIENAPRNSLDSFTNIWDDGYPSGGNYWSDFDEASEGAYDNDGDGIVDSPYSIPGGSNQDNYPLMTPYGVNYPPMIPIITGPTSGKAGEEYEYTFVTSDPDGDEVYYWIQWGEGCPTVEWIGPYDSGEEVTLTNSWPSKGTYTIQIKAKDTHGSESFWGELEVSMPKTYENPVWTFIDTLFERLEQLFRR
jgi:parallel beta-helix repeat protein